MHTEACRVGGSWLCNQNRHVEDAVGYATKHWLMPSLREWILYRRLNVLGNSETGRNRHECVQCSEVGKVTVVLK